MNTSIVQFPEAEKILHRKARPLTKDEILTDEIQKLILQMKQTMREAPGVGLAAPQVGISLQIAVIEDLEERLKAFDPKLLEERQRKAVPFHVLINPVITEHSDKILYYFEGCLSVSSGVRVVPRYESVKVTCLDEHAETREITATGWYARILQHEIDHLYGFLNIDRSDARTEISVEDYKEKWIHASGEKIYEHFCATCLTNED